MKKLLFLSVMSLAGTLLFAQKPVEGKRTAEVNLYFQTGTSPVSYGLPSNGFAPAELRFRYFADSHTALRMRFGLAAGLSKYAVSNGTNTAEVTQKTGLGFAISPGIEKHFEGTKRLSPYAGAQLGIMFGGGSSINVTNSGVENPSIGTIIQNDKYYKKNGSTLGVNFGLLIGTDYYITDGIYLGAELGLNILNYTNTAEGKVSKTTGGIPSEVRVLSSSNFNFFGISTGGIRLGFVF